MIPIYAVTVEGFSEPVTISAATASKARAEAWRRFNDAFECSFRDFLSISRVQKVSAPTDDGYGYVRRHYGLDVKIGQRVRLKNEGRMSGTEGEVIYPGTSTAHVHVQLDGRPDVSHVHPSSIEILE